MISWRNIQKQNFTSIKKLAEFLQIDPNFFIDSHFPLNLPKRLAEKIEKGYIHDAILRQFVPLKEEELKDDRFSNDPLNERHFQKSSKLLHKYESRALLITTSSCAMNCRFCFRRHFPYEKEVKGFDKELEIFRNDNSLKEIILSGGDPLSLSDESLSQLFQELEKIPHLKRIRFHTRFPIGIPERITDEFLKILEKSSKQIFFVIHTNHARELDDDVIFSLKQIQKLGIPILTHTVLLKDINNSTTTLKALFEKIVDHGFIPYYIFDLDDVSGATHFEVKETKGHQIMKELKTQLSGYAIPKYAKEIPGQSSKSILE